MKGLLAYVFVLVVIIGLHEFAHFLFCKIWGVKVIRFSIGLGPVLIGRKIGETEYQIAAIPLGGYVLPLSRKMDNMEGYEIHAEPDHPEKYFESKPPWQRVVIYLVGPLSNLLQAFVLCLGLTLLIGLPHPTNFVGALVVGYPAEQSGLKPGDRIDSVGGQPVSDWEDVVRGINSGGGKAVKILVLRDSEKKEFLMTPKAENAGGETIYRIGIKPAVGYNKVPPGLALKVSAVYTASTSKFYMGYFLKLFTGRVNMKGLSGPIGIYQVTDASAKQGWVAIIELMIMLNMSLFALNLLPIPGLDGGQIYPNLFEMLTGIKMSPKFEEVWRTLGVLMILSIFALAMWNDIARLFGK